MLHTNQSEVIFGRSREFRETMETVDAYAASPWPVLILGETGVGKELIARRFHQKSLRRNQAFVPINCGAMPGSLFESELFGYERGAFSGAQQSSRGLLRSASGGTVFLDEIGDLDLSLQVKLLRFLDTGEVRAVGATRSERVDVRIVAATNIDLWAAVRRGTFRQDLLERLSVLTVHLPALRDRKEDIVLIAESWLDSIRCQHEPSALALLCDYPWPGNVRQLRNLLLRASVRGKGRVTSGLIRTLLAEEAGRAQAQLANPEFLDGSLADIEKQVILYRLRRCRGNRKRTARELGIAKSTLHEKLRRWKDVDAQTDAPDDDDDSDMEKNDAPSVADARSGDSPLALVL